MSKHARIRDNLVYVESEIDGERLFTIKDPITGAYFRVREPERWLMQQLDGESSAEEIAARFRDKFGFNMAADQVEGFIAHLGKLLFLDDNRSEKEIYRASRKSARPESLFDHLMFIRFRVFKPGRFLDFLTGYYRFFHRPFWFGIEAAIILAGIVLTLANHDSIFLIRWESLFSLGSVAAVVLSLFTIILFHEFAHAIVCRYYGGEVREMGFLLLYLQPCFYCDTSDAWLFPKKTHRLAVMIAGPWYQLLLTAAAALLWRVLVPDTFISEVARIIVVISLTTYLFNFNPLIKLDGYYLLSDWVEVTNLRKKAFGYLGNVILRKLLGWPIAPHEHSQRIKRVLLTYSIVALVYTSILVGLLFLIIGRALAAAMGGAGLLLLALLLLIIFGTNLKAIVVGIGTHIKYMPNLLKQPLRLAIHLTIVVVVIVGTLVVQVPNRVSGDIVVQPIAEYRLSMNQYGLIESSFRLGGRTPEDKISIMQMNSSEMGTMEFVPLVRDGQKIREGDTLAMLASNQIVQEIETAGAELERLESKLALLRTPPKAEQVREADALVSAAETAWRKRKNDFDLAAELSEKDLISTQELEDSRSAHDIAYAELQSRQSALELLKSPPRPEEETVLIKEIEKQRTRLNFLQSQGDAQVIVAPFDGIVTRNIEAGAILSLIDQSLVELLIPVSDFDISRVRDGQPVTVKVRSYPGQLYEGEVVRIPEAATEQNGQYRFNVVAIVDNAEYSLHNGMTGYARIEVGESSVMSLFYQKTLSKLRVEFWSWL